MAGHYLELGSHGAGTVIVLLLTIRLVAIDEHEVSVKCSGNDAILALIAPLGDRICSTNASILNYNSISALF